MFNEVSCWYVDWSAIGTWVGGIGAFAAASAAVWAVQKESRRREAYSRFLLEQDLERLDRAHHLLKSMATYLGMTSLEDPDTGKRPDWETLFEEAQQSYKNLIREFEYFGNSEQQFVYRPRFAEFSKVQVLMRGLSNQLDAMHELGFHVDEGAAATEATEGAERIRIAVHALREKLGFTKIATQAVERR